MADHFRKGDRVCHLMTKKEGTVLRVLSLIGFVHVQYDVDCDLDGVVRTWLIEAAHLSHHRDFTSSGSAG